MEIYYKLEIFEAEELKYRNVIILKTAKVWLSQKINFRDIVSD